MKALGINTYLGGMQHGVSKHMEDLGSCENWRDGLEGREVMGTFKTLKYGHVEPADVVYANPPCSRFSNSASDYFDDDGYAGLEGFECLAECMQKAIDCRAAVFWWETGPLAFKAGDRIAADVNRKFGAVSSWKIRLDLVDLGVPQRRPRCHFVHFRYPAGLPKIKVVNPHSAVRQWLEIEAPNAATPGGPSLDEMSGWGCRDVEQFVDVKRLVGTRFSWNPKIIRVGMPFAPAIMARPIGFPDRWMHLEEAAALMGLPQEEAARLRPWKAALRLMSKGVSSVASGTIAEQVLHSYQHRGGGHWCQDGLRRPVREWREVAS